MCAWLLAGLVACTGKTGNRAAELPRADDPFDQVTLTAGGTTFRVNVARTAAERDVAPRVTRFHAGGDAAQGVLYVYPKNSDIVFRHREVSVATTLVFLDDAGTVLEIQREPPTPVDPAVELDFEAMRRRYMAQFGQGSDIKPEMARRIEAYALEQYKQQIANSRIRWAFPLAPGTPVTAVLQVRQGQLAKLKRGDRVALPAEAMSKPADPPGPIVQLKATAQRGAPVRLTLRLEVAGTAAGRERLLSAPSLARLAREPKKTTPLAYVLLYPEDQAPRAITLRGLPHGLDVVFAKRPNAEGGNFTGTLVPLWSYEPSAGEVLPRDVVYPSRPYARNYETTHKAPGDTLILLRSGTWRTLKLDEAKWQFSMPCPPGVLRAPIEPDATALVFRVKPANAEPVTVRLAVLDTDDARRAGLASREALPPVAAGGARAPGPEPVPAAAGWRPPPLDAPATPDGFLLRYDRDRDRPLEAGGLEPPYDLGLVDAAGNLIRVFAIDKRPTRDEPRFAGTEFRSAWVMPKGWFAAHGFAPQATAEGVAAHTLEAPLTLPAALKRRLPEPQRFEIQVGGVPVQVELVIKGDEVARGLQWRRWLAPDSGMLFLYGSGRDGSHGFWMPNCLFDQTIAYVGSDWSLVALVDLDAPNQPGYNERDIETTDDRGKKTTKRRHRNTQAACNSAANAYAPGATYQFALEMQRGWYVDHDVRNGDLIEPNPVIRQYVAQLAAQGD